MKTGNETAAAIFVLVWKAFMYFGLLDYMIFGSSFGWYLFGLDTAVQITILYYNTRLSRREEQLHKARRYLARLSEEYLEEMGSHSYDGENYTDGYAPSFIDVTENVSGKKRRYNRKVG